MIFCQCFTDADDVEGVANQFCLIKNNSIESMCMVFFTLSNSVNVLYNKLYDTGKSGLCLDVFLDQRCVKICGLLVQEVRTLRVPLCSFIFAVRGGSYKLKYNNFKLVKLVGCPSLIAIKMVTLNCVYYDEFHHNQWP